MSAKAVCRFWQKGTCKRGSFCNFMHGTGELDRLRDAMLKETGAPLGKIEVNSLKGATDSDVNISPENYEFLSSYNWVNSDIPTIYVPGAPPVWKSKVLPFSVLKDEGTFFVDQNTARCPAYPAEALFRSLKMMKPNFDMRDIDVVTDRNCLRKLLRFVSEDMDRSFRVDIKLQGDVMFLCRWEPKLKETIPTFQNRGYGHNFEKAATCIDNDLGGSSGHHRVVRYNLGVIRCMVRFEVDACSEGVENPGQGAKAESSNDSDDLLVALKSMTVSPSTETEESESVVVVNKGHLVQLSNIIEIKTRAVGRELRLEEATPQLWFAQTQKLYVGYHTNGEFRTLKKLAMEDEFIRWQIRHQNNLAKLVSLLRELKSFASAAKGRNCVAVCEIDKSSQITIYESTRMGAALPDDIIKQYKWTNTSDSAKRSSDATGIEAEG